MSTTKILSRWDSSRILFECETPAAAPSGLALRHALEKAAKSGANLSGADLRGANLNNAYLSGANLSDAYLSDADLSGAYLSDANLSDANLSDADLSDANLRRANLRRANLDFSLLHFSCKSRKPKTDEKQRIQLTHHLLSWIKYSENATEFEKQLFEFAKDYANKFHRPDVEKFD